MRFCCLSLRREQGSTCAPVNFSKAVKSIIISNCTVWIRLRVGEGTFHPISKYFSSDVSLFAEVNTQGYTRLGDQLSFQPHTFLSLVAESQRQGCSLSPAHMAGAVRDEFPEALGNREQSCRAPRGWGSAGGAAAAQSVSCLILPRLMRPRIHRGNATGGEQGMESAGGAPG